MTISMDGVGNTTTKDSSENVELSNWGPLTDSQEEILESEDEAIRTNGVIPSSSPESNIMNKVSLDDEWITQKAVPAGEIFCFGSQSYFASTKSCCWK